jgi:hypothetical protein
MAERMGGGRRWGVGVGGTWPVGLHCAHCASGYLVPDSKTSGTRFETICLKCKFYSGPALVNYFALFCQKITFIENLLTEKHAESRGDNPVSVRGDLRMRLRN